MKVAMFVNNTGNGDLRVHRQASLLAANGFQVRLFCFLEPGLPEKEERAGYTIQREDQRPWLTRFFDDHVIARIRPRAPAEAPQAPAEVSLPADRDPVRPCPAPAERALAANSPDHVREHRRYVETLNGIWADAARRWKPDVCHAHDADTLAAAGSLGLPLVYDAHELWSEQPFICDRESVDYWNRLEGEWIRKATHVFTVNQPLADVLFERYGVRAVALHNCQSLQPRPGRAEHTGPPIALYQGVFAPDRGLEELLAASAYLNGEVVVAVRGFGERETCLRELAARHKLPVQFWPAVPASGIVAAAAEADMAVIPFLPSCLNHYLSTPNKLFEAMMAGVPIAGSDIPELRSFVLQRGLGVLFDPYSPRDVARALRELAQGDLRGMGDAARKLAELEFHWEHEGRKLLIAYQELAGRGKTIARHER